MDHSRGICVRIYKALFGTFIRQTSGAYLTMKYWRTFLASTALISVILVPTGVAAAQCQATLNIALVCLSIDDILLVYSSLTIVLYVI